MRWRKHWSPLDGDWLQFLGDFCLLVFCLSKKEPLCLKRYFGNICKITYFVQYTALFIWYFKSWRTSISPGNALFSPATVQLFCIKENIRKRSVLRLGHFFGNKLLMWTFLCWSYWLKTLRTQGTFLIYSQKKNSPVLIRYCSTLANLKMVVVILWRCYTLVLHCWSVQMLVLPASTVDVGTWSQHVSSISIAISSTVRVVKVT